ncbi:MAG: IS66 family transposase [Candidatus Bilamarchaeaceae archaeon]
MEQPREQKEPEENQRNALPRTYDRKERHTLKRCPDCGGKLTKKKRKYKRTIIHIELPQSEVVLHECGSYYCATCKKEVIARVHDALPKSKFDLQTAVFISFLYVALNVSTGKIAQFFSEILGIDISKATISNTLVRLKNYLGEEYDYLEEEIKKAKVRYRDETGWRHSGKNFWAWVVATSKGVIYRIEKRRSHSVAAKLKADRGVDVSDGYTAYNKLTTQKQRCWAHMLRIARNPEYGFTDEREYTAYVRLVEKLGKLFHDAKEAKKRKKVSAKLRARFDKRLEKLLLSVKWLGKNADKLINYIMHFNGEWFTFLEYKEVEPTNNKAERSLRHVVIKRKISQQSRSIDGMNSYAMQASLYMTSHQKQEKYTDYLMHVLENKIHE